MVMFAPSLMCANYLFLEKDIDDLYRAGADLLHVDIMDGHFVPNLSLNFDIVKQVKTITNIPLDVHLMVENPDNFFNGLKAITPEYVSFHLEVVDHPIRLINELKCISPNVGVAVSPATSIDSLEYIIKYLDYVVIMTVEPGFAGQKFIPSMLKKIEKVRKLGNDLNQKLLIEVDGNISETTARQCMDAGADILVLGTASIFKKGRDLYTSMVEFKNNIENNLSEAAF